MKNALTVLALMGFAVFAWAIETALDHHGARISRAWRELAADRRRLRLGLVLVAVLAVLVTGAVAIGELEALGAMLVIFGILLAAGDVLFRGGGLVVIVAGALLLVVGHFLEI